MSVFSALLNNGPTVVGPLADRGTFDQYAQYRPGQIVVDDGTVYLNIAAVGVTPVLEDTFDRRDQSGWGQSSHGEVWQSSSALGDAGPPSISGGVGLARWTTDGRTDGQLLGPAALHTNPEILVRLDLPVPASGEHDVINLGLNASEDAVSKGWCVLTVADDGTTTLLLHSVSTSDTSTDSDAEAGPTVVAGQTCWLRLRAIGFDYSATLWPEGTVEPTTPQVTHTANGALNPGHGYLGLGTGTLGDTVAFRYFVLRDLSTATAPADDTDHWVALGDALQVAPPL